MNLVVIKVRHNTVYLFQILGIREFFFFHDLGQKITFFIKKTIILRKNVLKHLITLKITYARWHSLMQWME